MFEKDKMATGGQIFSIKITVYIYLSNSLKIHEENSKEMNISSISVNW